MLQPFLMGRWVSVHPLGVILAIAAGVLTAGVAGALVAVPLAAAVNAVVQHLAAYTDPGDDPVEELAEDYEETGETSPVEDEDPPAPPERLRRPRRRCGRWLTPGRGDAGRRRGGARADPRRRDRDPDGAVALALRAGRRPGLAQVREPPAHRLVQDPRRLRPDLPAQPRGARARRRRGLGRQPRPGRRAGRAAARHPARRCSCPRGRRSPRSGRPAGTAPTWSSRAACSRSRWSAARRFAEETGAVLIHPFDHVDIVAGQGTLGLEVLEQVPDVQTVLVPDRRRRPAGRRGDRRQGAAPRRAGGRASRRPGAAAYPASLEQGAPGPAGVDEDDGRRHRGRAARRRSPSPRSATTSTRSRTVSEESLSRALLALVERAKHGRRARRRGRASPRCSTTRTTSRPRWSRCSPAATSTRCCSAR